ncbi:MAG: phosphatase PAP2 family protein [Actinomycetota bacterium]|nr:phosphatase PAP2 family protein [Actinomycetota bacterium]
MQPPLPRDLALLLAVQRAFPGTAAVIGARGLSLLGEHAAAWLAIGATAAAVDRDRRRGWCSATVSVAVSHAASVAIKRLVRRQRPLHVRLMVHSGGLGRWGFPSSHTASTTTAALAFRQLTGARWILALPPAMGLSRLIVGAHFPSDVVAGAALGVATADAHRRLRWQGGRP